jgi:hypothetical protein
MEGGKRISPAGSNQQNSIGGMTRDGFGSEKPNSIGIPMARNLAL